MNIKSELHKKCLESVDTQISTIEKQLASLKEAMENETKSSVGDKYETGRAMIQNEKDQLMKQLSVSIQLRTKLQQINPSKSNDKVELGSLIISESGNYYISVGVGKIVIQNTTYFAISALSPIAKVLYNKRKEDCFEFRSKKFKIIDVT